MMAIHLLIINRRTKEEDHKIILEIIVRMATLLLPRNARIEVLQVDLIPQ
jgi:hypothetical protein